MSEMAFWICMLVVGTLAFLVFVWVVVDAILQRRKKKHAKKIFEQYERERAARKPDPEAEEDTRRFFTIWMSKDMEDRIGLIQVQTKVESPGEVMHDALRFYADIVNMHSPGDQLVLHKAPDMHGVLLNFPPLQRIEKKVES